MEPAIGSIRPEHSSPCGPVTVDVPTLTTTRRAARSRFALVVQPLVFFLHRTLRDAVCGTHFSCTLYSRPPGKRTARRVPKNPNSVQFSRSGLLGSNRKYGYKVSSIAKGFHEVFFTMNYLETPRHQRARSGPQPTVSPFADKIIVIQMRVGIEHPADLF